jgi:phosphoenolpyruvate synthase/pyruvate phosphate dikinase
MEVKKQRGAITMTSSPTYTLDFSQIGMQDVSRVGGKNASLDRFCERIGREPELAVRSH